MKTFLSVHQDDILGQITMFDRMIFRGHLLSFFPKDAFLRFLLSLTLPRTRGHVVKQYL